MGGVLIGEELLSLLLDVAELPPGRGVGLGDGFPAGRELNQYFRLARTKKKKEEETNRLQINQCNIPIVECILGKGILGRD